MWTALLSAALAAASMVTGLAALNFDWGAIGDPTRVLDVGERAAQPAYWSMLLDLFGYYLLLLPMTVILWRDVRRISSAWADIVNLMGVLYLLIGAAGAAVLAAAWPPLIRAYHAGSNDAAAIRVVFDTVTAAVDRGLWNTLEITLAGVWWFGLGCLLPRGSALAVVSLVLGVSCWVDSGGTMVQASAVSNVGLTLYLVLAPAWAVVAALHVKRGT